MRFVNLTTQYLNEQFLGKNEDNEDRLNAFYLATVRTEMKYE